MVEYSIIAPPFTLKFREMNRRELKDYFKWFMAIMPSRIEILVKAVRSSPGYENWEPSYLPESLSKLGEWFAKQVETRLRAEGEIQEIRGKAPPTLKNIQIIDYELTNRTFSLAIDIGMYLSQVFLKTIPALKWKHITKGTKRSIDYGQPVLGDFGKINFNPIHMMVTQAYGIADHTWDGTELRRLYEIWKKLAVQQID
jgi:hypothetical protein